MMRHRLSFCISIAASAFLSISCTENPPPAKEQTMLEKKQEARQKFFESLKQPQAMGSPDLASPLNVPASLSGNTTTVITGGPATPPPTVAARSSTSGSLSAAGTTASLAPSARDSAIHVPANAEWTLVCLNLTTPDRFQRMAQMKTYLLARTSLKDWYIIHDDQKSSLFYGFYGSIHANDPRDPSGRKAQADKKTISDWVDPGTGDRPFAQCMFTRIAEPEPPAPAEWRLSNAPAEGYWSLQIAAFQGDTKRKEAAVEAVREMRSKGIEAFYYHGNTISSVCVGAWPRHAIKEQEADGGTAIVNQEDAVFISNKPLPDYLKNTKMKNSEGQNVRAMTERVEIQDKSLLAAMKNYPYHYVNYTAVLKEGKDAAGKKVDVVAPSFLVIVPREAGFSAETANFMNPRAANGTADAPRTPRVTPGASRLPSLDDPSPR